MRLFVALALPREVQDHFATLISELRSLLPEMRWTPVKNIHLTLKFLGEISDDSLPAKRRVLEKVKRDGAIWLRAAGLGSFDAHGKGGVVFAKIMESAQLAQLVSEISTRLETAGVEPEARPFVPHLTLGRSKDGRLPETLDEVLARFGQWKLANLQLSEFHLFESKRKATGAEYTILQSFSFVTEPRN